jgi:glycosyltransferase involved in cell wall biosynthesis
MIKYSAVIITKNEADNIARCIQSLLPVTEEILIIDSGSADNTIDIAKGLGAKVIETKWLGYSETKNLGNKAAENDWIISIDADEVVSESLQQSIKNLSPQNNTVYTLNRMTNYCGKWIRHSGWFPDKKVRIFNKKEIYWQGDFVHETLHIPSHYSNFELTGILEHYSYKSLDDHWERLNKYAELSAREMHNKGKKANFIKLYLAPAFRFFRTLVLKKGILDGKEGWIISSRNAYMVRKKYRLLQQLNKQAHEQA